MYQRQQSSERSRQAGVLAIASFLPSIGSLIPGFGTLSPFASHLPGGDLEGVADNGGAPTGRCLQLIGLGGTVDFSLSPGGTGGGEIDENGLRLCGRVHNAIARFIDSNCPGGLPIPFGRRTIRESQC